MWQTIFLIGLLHGSASLDAWSTNRFINGCPVGFRCGQVDPLVRPFAGKPTIYVAVNEAMVPLHIWLLSGKRRRAARIIGLATTGSHLAFAMHNVRLTGSMWDRWRQDQALMRRRVDLELYIRPGVPEVYREGFALTLPLIPRDTARPVPVGSP
jgi:hypothetical protein